MKTLFKKVIILVVDSLTFLKGFNFPATFIWRWKVEYLLETYESETTKFFKKNIHKGMTVIDVGANLGYFTRVFAKLVGSTGCVYAFEPDAQNWDLLVKNTRHRKNVFLSKEAVSDTVGTVDFFHVHGMTGTHTTLEVPNATKYTVAANTLDNFCRSKNIARVDFIKIDVEGAEDKVFAGMRELLAGEGTPTVVFEYTPDTSQSLLESLQQTYNLFAITRDGSLTHIDNLEFRQGKRAYANVVLRGRK